MTHFHMGKAALAAVSVLAAALAAAPAGASSSANGSERGEAPSFHEFKDSTYRDTDQQYLVNGDEPEASTGSLRQYYDRMMEDHEGGKPGKTHEDGLVINRVYGVDDKWSASKAMNLSYCVSNNFGSQQSNVINAMAQGTALWETASSKVNFVYVPSANSNCRTSNNAVVFSVEPTYTTQYIARAFFPSTKDAQRNILVNASSLMNSGSWTPGNIMGHELGHTLGFRHEHTRPEAGTCFEDNNWRALTPYDSASIMHYPQCNGSSNNLSFTSQDGNGVRAAYGS